MPSAAKRRAKAPKPSINAAGSASSTGISSALPTSGISDEQREWTFLKPALSPWLLDALTDMNYTRMTPVQAYTIPLFLGNKDVVVEAVTGSGKTLAFLIPIIERILRTEPAGKNHVQAIVVSPTRELAAQIHSVLLSLLAFHRTSPDALTSTKTVKPLLLLGGSHSPTEDLKNFLTTSPNLLIGTPGRLNSLLSQQHVLTSTETFECLVLDEADRLLDLGFKEILSSIIARLPKQRRTGLFSATITDALVGSLLRTGLRNPMKIQVKVNSLKEERRTPTSLQTSYILASPSQRLVYLRRLFSSDCAPLYPTGTLPQKSILYLSNCAAVDYFTMLFAALLPGPNAKDGMGFILVPLHGKQSPSTRKTNFRKFCSATRNAILITTDVAARGLDIPELDLVLQWDAPTDPKVFVHRCGRAGRAGRRGLAIVFLASSEEAYIGFLDVRKTPVTQIKFPTTGLGKTPDKEEVYDCVRKMRTVVLKDRAICDKGLKAFVSHIRAYSKHQTTSIFRIMDLDWHDLASSFALLKMPKMPELKNTGSLIELDVSVDWGTYAYKDKKKEAERLASMQEDNGERRLKIYEERKKLKRKNTAWSEKKEGKEERGERRERKRAKRESIKWSKMGDEEKAREGEWQEMVAEIKRRRKKQETENGEYTGLD